MTPNSPNCAQALLVQADFDGELDAATSAQLAAHRADCPICQGTLETLQTLRQELRAQDSAYYPAGSALRQRLAASLAAQQPKPPPRSWRAAFSAWTLLPGMGLGAALASLVLVTILPNTGGVDQTDLLIADHVRALQPGHLLDIPSTNQHNVKPWFEGKLDFGPPVKNLAPQGFPLEGGRLDYLPGRIVAGLVYRRDQHPINLLVWPETGQADTKPVLVQKNGYNLIEWRQDGMALRAISDLNATELQQFVEFWRQG